MANFTKKEWDESVEYWNTAKELNEGDEVWYFESSTTIHEFNISELKHAKIVSISIMEMYHGQDIIEYKLDNNETIHSYLGTIYNNEADAIYAYNVILRSLIRLEKQVIQDHERNIKALECKFINDKL